jgi:hypothetical protein
MAETRPHRKVHPDAMRELPHGADRDDKQPYAAEHDDYAHGPPPEQVGPQKTRVKRERSDTGER